MGWLYYLTRNSRFLSIHTAHIGTLTIQRTPPALWPLCMANLASVTNEVDV